MSYLKENRGISKDGLARIAKAVDANSWWGNAEDLFRWLRGVVLLKESVGGNYSAFGGTVDMDEEVVHVAVVHDGSGYTPGAALHFSHSHEDEAVQEAFESLENIILGQLSDEERKEMWETEDKEGYNPVTETFDGRVFTMTPEEFKQVIESVEGRNGEELSVIEFDYPEEDIDTNNDGWR